MDRSGKGQEVDECNAEKELRIHKFAKWIPIDSFLIHFAHEHTYIWLIQNGARDVDSTTLQISCRSQVRSVGRDVVRVDEPTPILQVSQQTRPNAKCIVA